MRSLNIDAITSVDKRIVRSVYGYHRQTHYWEYRLADNGMAPILTHLWNIYTPRFVGKYVLNVPCSENTELDWFTGICRLVADVRKVLGSTTPRAYECVHSFLESHYAIGVQFPMSREDYAFFRSWHQYNIDPYPKQRTAEDIRKSCSRWLTTEYKRSHLVYDCLHNLVHGS